MPGASAVELEAEPVRGRLESLPGLEGDLVDQAPRFAANRGLDLGREERRPRPGGLHGLAAGDGDGHVELSDGARRGDGHVFLCPVLRAARVHGPGCRQQAGPLALRTGVATGCGGGGRGVRSGW